MKKKKRLLLVAVIALLSACAQGPKPAPATNVVFQEVVKEVKRPCPIKKPVLPGRLARPLPSNASSLIDALTAKLLEWAGPGGYGERADKALTTCLNP